MIRRHVSTGAECACGHGWQLFEPGVCWHCAGGPLTCRDCEAEAYDRGGRAGLMPFPPGATGPLQWSGLCDAHEAETAKKRVA